MGLPVKVSVTPMGRVALFVTDRTLTGQEGIVYLGPPAASHDPPSLLASRLFASSLGIEHVHIASNTATVSRDTDWDEADLDTAARIVSDLFVHYTAPEPVTDEERYGELRRGHYNATITDIRAHNEDLWVMMVRPDEPVEPFQPGQYTTLALGYWEPRIDGIEEELTEDQREKLARRSYSVSSSILDENGELLPRHPEEIEFYVVLVKPGGPEEIPALTPRLFLKREGDRLFMGRKFTGRYTLEGVRPTDNVVFLSTGTGEAPQNAMIAELLRREHEGRIMSVVCVRYRADLAYTDVHAVLEERHSNYRYLTLTTREPENEGNKVYIQDLVKSGRLEEELGLPLEPGEIHVFLCGNPAMIGLPTWEDGEPVFPDELGVCQLLYERGFTIDHRRERGNVHYEEYW